MRPTLIACLVSSSIALGQGRDGYFNDESPLVRPLTTATVNNVDLLLVCNAPDNALEVWRTNEALGAPWTTGTNPTPNPARFVGRVPVGLPPVTVKTRQIGSALHFWTCNYLGDSITHGQIVARGTDVEVIVDRTVNVGDEPTDLDFYNLDGTLAVLVCQQTSSSYGAYDALTLAPVTTLGAGTNASRVNLVLDDPVVYETDSGGDNDLKVRFGVKEPRVVNVLTGGARDLAMFLAFKGGDLKNGSDTDEDYLWNQDLDLMLVALRTGSTNHRPPVIAESIPRIETDHSALHRGIGSTNFNMRVASNGDVYVVGMEAMNWAHDDKITLRAEPTGFVQSTLWRIPGPIASTSDLNRSQNRRDLNIGNAGSPVGTSGALAMATDLALLETSGGVQRIYVTAFGSDRIGMFRRVNGGGLNLNAMGRSVMNLPAPRTGYSRRGPRAIHLQERADGTRRLYVLNRLDSSIVSLNPTTANLPTLVEDWPMARDAEPQHVRDGRRFLYDASLSGNGFTSCASCHTEGRTDGLAWRLGDSSHVGPSEPGSQVAQMTQLMGGVRDSGEFNFLLQMLDEVKFDPEGSEDKREMITQSLQGLANSEFDVSPVGAENSAVNKQNLRDLYTNAPFHWRGDKRTFLDFNEAFVTLMHPSPDPTLPPESVRKLTDVEMQVFEEFIFSLSYPPNSEEPRTRTYSSGGQEGLDKFHTLAISSFANLSCVHCHQLPVGSDNRITCALEFSEQLGFVKPDGLIPNNRQPTETPGLRGLLQKEPVVQQSGNIDTFDYSNAEWADANNPDNLRVGHYGLTHVGTLMSRPTDPEDRRGQTLLTRNTFVDSAIPQPALVDSALAVRQFLHEFDTGVAPMVGASITLTPADASTAAATLEPWVTQANLGNTGLAVQIQSRAGASAPITRRGAVWSPTAARFARLPILNPIQFVDLAGLFAGLSSPDDRLVFVATPLGEERRVGDPVGVTAPVATFAPTEVFELSLVPNTANTSIPVLEGNAHPTFVDSTTAFTSGGVPIPRLTLTDHPGSLLLRLYRSGLFAESSLTGVIHLARHEAPRRIRVRGRNILPGAVLHLYTPVRLPGDGAVPATWNTARWQQEIATLGTSNPTVMKVTLPLFDVQGGSLGGESIWETAVELSPQAWYVLCLGGPGAPGVRAARDWSVWSSLDLAKFNDPGKFGFASAPVFDEPNNPVLGYTTGGDASPFSVANWNWHFVEIENPRQGGAPLLLQAGAFRLHLP